MKTFQTKEYIKKKHKKQTIFNVNQKKKMKF